MGWSTGSEIMDKVISQAEDLGYEESLAWFSILIKIFEDYDCDTLGECLGQDVAFDDAYFLVNPGEA
jgi:hypothetical protein